MQLKNLTQTQDGKYMWDIMEPWAIRNFGSNVAGEENSVRVPQEVKAWYGSHTSGTYGYLGYDIPWDDVVADKIPQTLYIPSGCDLTFVNMEILSGVRIVVENGGKLTLQDSVVQGIIEVEDGGTFSMNYNGYGGEGEFLTGSSLCGQLRLEDGAILENAAIYSHINYLANGDLTDRTSNEPVVVATGNVTVRGQVFIQGDEAGDNNIGQTGLRVQNGTLTVEDGAVLVVYGGDATVQFFRHQRHRDPAGQRNHHRRRQGGGCCRKSILGQLAVSLYPEMAQSPLLKHSCRAQQRIIHGLTRKPARLSAGIFPSPVPAAM